MISKLINQPTNPPNNQQINGQKTPINKQTVRKTNKSKLNYITKKNQ